MPPKFTGQRPAEAMGPRMITIITAQVKQNGGAYVMCSLCRFGFGFFGDCDAARQELRLCLGEQDILTQWIDT